MLPATIASSNISDQTPPQQYRHPSATKIQPRQKKLPKQFHLTTSEAFRQNIEFLKSNSYSDNQKSSEIINHLRANIHIQASHSFYYDYIMNN